MSQVITELIQQWLEANEASFSIKSKKPDFSTKN
ncbi:hypothetical protein [Tolypothrix sp. NIES-4075]|nr:hypothetical protein [Tolypothrix sp. NIES-4075]